MTSWALIVFALGTKPELVGVYKTESECVRIHDMIKLIGMEGRTRGTETSNYPEEKKSTEIPKVVASEMGTACK